jgi:hypothetical protein
MNYRWKGTSLYVFFLFLSVQVPMRAMDSGKKRGHDETVDFLLVKKTKVAHVLARDIPSLQAIVAAYIAKKKMEKNGAEQPFESFSQLYPVDIAYAEDGYSRYNSEAVQLPDILACYVYARELSLAQ